MPASDPTTASPSTTPASNGWRRTRLAFYFAMLGIALGVLWQHWQVQRIVERRAAVVEMLQLPARDMVQGWQVDRAAAALLGRAVQAPSGASDVPSRGDAVGEIESVLARLVEVADADARKGEPLLAVIAAGAGEAARPLRQAWQTWQDGRMQLVQQLRTLVDEARGAGAEQLPQTVMTVHAQLGVVSQYSAALMSQLQQRAAALLARQIEVQRWGTGLTMVLLLLSCAVIAPALRLLQAQARRLATQAADNERLAVVAEHTGNLVLITDRERRITWVNDAFVRESGFALRDVIGRTPREVLVDADADPQALARLQQALDEGRSVQMPLLHRTREGKPYWVSVDIQPLHDRLGALSGFISVATVITEQLTQQMRGQALLAALPTAVVVHGVRGEVVQVNAAAAALLDLRAGDPADSLLQHGPLDDELEPMEAQDLPVQRCLRTGRGERGQLIAIDDGEGGRRWLLVHTEMLHDALGQRDGVVACYVDVTERRRLLEQLRDSAMHDALTRLPNRTVVLERIQRAIEHRRRHPAYGFAVLFMDVDRFKQVNDTLGHIVGDVALEEVARRLRDCLRPSDHLARIGGDEFLALLPETRFAEGLQVAERLRQAVSAAPVHFGLGTTRVSASVGVALVPAGVRALDELMAHADLSLRHSKEAGKNRVSAAQVREGEVHCTVPAAALVEALRRGERLRAFAQPILRLEDESLAGVEMLTRGPRGPYEMPSELFQIGMEHDILTVLDLHCLRTCLQAAERVDAPRLHLNVFPATIVGTTTDQFLGLLPEGRDPGSICLEVSEQQFVGDAAELLRTLQGLRERGMCIALDDVGFGRTSLETLITLEPDMVKIDGSYVAGIAQDDGKRRSLARLVAVVRHLGRELVAEGIESRADLEVLRELGVRFGQGFVWGQPKAV